MTMPRPTRILSKVVAPPPEAVAVESDLVVILAALLCALICVVGLIAVARCACLRRRRGTATDSSNGSNPKAAANKGLKKKFLQSLPTFTYSQESSGRPRFATMECAICLGDFAEGDRVRVLPQCGHGFHRACVDTWLASHSSCPSCRQIPVVSRCQKCGHFPGVEPQMKPANEDGHADSVTNYHTSNRFLP